MSKEEIYTRLQSVFRDVFDNDTLTIHADTTAADIDDWDSLSHVGLIVAIEQAFGVRFTSREILSWTRVGEMADALCQKCS